MIRVRISGLALAALSCVIPFVTKWAAAQAQPTIQQEPAQAVPSQQSTGKTQVKVNFLNVCTPSEVEQQELSAALGRLPVQAKFAPDFEVSRGRTTVTEPVVKLEAMDEAAQAGPGSPPISNWVRLRREFPASSPLLSVQYSFSLDQKNAEKSAEKKVVETLVFRSREAKDVIETSLEDKVSAAADPSQVLTSDTPVERIRIERFGKPSVVLARCPAADQSAYEPLFQKASQIMARYRSLLDIRQTVPADLHRLGVAANGVAANGAGANSSSKPTSHTGKRSKSISKPKPTPAPDAPK